MTIESPVWMPRGSKFWKCQRAIRAAERAAYLHVAADNDVVGRIPDDLVLELLPSLERLFDQDLRAQTQTLGA